MSNQFNGLSLNNTESVIADHLFLLVDTELKNIYDIFATIDDLNNVTGFDQNAINILTNIANVIGNDPNFISDIWTELNLKAYISQTYSRVYIDNLISNYYSKSQIDTLLLPQSPIYTASLVFQDVNNLGIDTLTIEGGVNINIKNNTNISLMDFSSTIVEIHPPFKTYSTATFVGNLTAPNIYNKTEIDNLLSALSSNILATDSHVIRCAKIQFTDVLNVGVTNLDIVGGANITVKDQNSNALMDLSNLSIDIHTQFKCYSTVQIVGNLTAPNIYNKTEVNNLLD